MGRSVIGLCIGFGSVVGGYVPALWGASSFSIQSLLFGVIGAASASRTPDRLHSAPRPDYC